MERKSKEVECRERKGMEIRLGGKSSKETKEREMDLFQNSGTGEGMEEAREKEKGDKGEAEW